MKPKVYTIKLSRHFLKGHPRAGEPTYFVEKFYLGQGYNDAILFDVSGEVWPKLHTIRGNYELWAARIREVQEGKAVLRVQYWSGIPFRSKATTICDLTAADGIGVQKVEFIDNELVIIDKKHLRPIHDVAQNDGLAEQDFLDWFRNYNLSEPMALIQFTEFRY